LGWTSNRQAQGLKGNYGMPVSINITKRDRIYINPFNGQVLPRLTKGLSPDTSDLGDGGESEEESGVPTEAGSEETQ
jgi:hypothetical protein